MMKEFYTIKEVPLEINPDMIVEAHAINNKQVMVMYSNGGKVLLNCSFEEFQFFLTDNTRHIWVYANGICGSTVMFDPDKIESVEYANPSQCELIFDNKKKLYVELSREEMSKRIEFAKKVLDDLEYAKDVLEEGNEFDV